MLVWEKPGWAGERSCAGAALLCGGVAWGAGLDGLCMEPGLVHSSVTSGARSQQVLLEAGHEEGCSGEHGEGPPPGFSMRHEEGRATDGEALPRTSANLVQGICRRKEKPLGQEGADPA